MLGEFALNPLLDVEALATEFSRRGRVTIKDFLRQDVAETLARYLREREDWIQVFNSGDKLIELDRKTREGLPPEKIEALNTAIQLEARTKFQYRYETIRVPDGTAEREQSGDPLARFATWMSSGEARQLLRRITGEDRIEFADAQATAYSPGDFLTEHTDLLEGKKRFAAYVLGLSPAWAIAWGGLLLFHASDQQSAEAIVPQFNCLNLFSVPQPHSVSMVTGAAPYRRYSITGWLRQR